MQTDDFISNFKRKLFSGASVIWVYVPGDEQRAEDTIQYAITGKVEKSAWPAQPPLIIDEKPAKYFRWDVITGTSWPTNDAITDPLAAIEAVGNLSENGVVVMRDLHLLLNAQSAFGLRRLLIQRCQAGVFSNDTHMCPIVILADTAVPHPDIKDYVRVVDFPRPNEDTLYYDVVLQLQSSLEAMARAEVRELPAPPSADLGRRLAKSLLGLTVIEAKDIAFEAVTQTQTICEAMLPLVAEEKITCLKKLEGLTYVPRAHLPKPEEIGGYETCKEFLRVRSRAYTEHARANKKRKPRGICLIGPAGCGKTRFSQAVASLLGMDLVIMDVGAMYDSLVGSSEKRMRVALAAISAMRNCVLAVDEVDKVMAGAHQNQQTDSGISGRILSYWLKWLADRDVSADSDEQIFVVVTMNRIDGIPPEFLRAGRFDRVFSADLPTPAERQEILRIHLRKNDIDPEQYGKGLSSLMSPTELFSGAELEEVVISADFAAYDNRMRAWEAHREGPPPSGTVLNPTIDELLEAAATIVPVARLDAADTDKIRNFCKSRTTPVSALPPAEPTRRPRGVRASDN